MNENNDQAVSKPFRFHQFEIRQDRSAMKVGTDAILLGAWAGQEMIDVTSVLDIGTGTGVIALMMAQRFPPAAITAIDIDHATVAEAAENFRNSPWGDRCRAKVCAAQEFNEGPFDLIVSNPPWFRDGPRPDDEGRAIARHEVSLSAAELFVCAERKLAANGRLCVVIPFESGDHFRTEAADSGFCLRRCRSHGKRVWQSACLC